MPLIWKCVVIVSVSSLAAALNVAIGTGDDKLLRSASPATAKYDDFLDDIGLQLAESEYRDDILPISDDMKSSFDSIVRQIRLEEELHQRMQAENATSTDETENIQDSEKVEEILAEINI